MTARQIERWAWVLAGVLAVIAALRLVAGV